MCWTSITYGPEMLLAVGFVEKARKANRIGQQNRKSPEQIYTRPLGCAVGESELTSFVPSARS